ncbi:MAG: type IV pilus assembly protein PilM [Syntrophorhabdaceae bacterium]|nr:type IV pilus assembly protein PilM [Syntrophorhabdaceae bacterium]MDD4195204.1 type IV pilus assembly protein PilM [Syntrophorhabdaceae bacterium]
MANPFEAFGTAAFILPVLIYVVTSYVLYRIGRKFELDSPFWHYLVPFYNMVLMCRCGGVSAWNVLGMMIFPINIYSTINVWGSIAEKLGKSYWLYGITTLLLGIPVFILAFDSSAPTGKAAYADKPSPFTDGASGDPFEEGPAPVDPSLAFASQTVNPGATGISDPPVNSDEDAPPVVAGDAKQKKYKTKKGFFVSLKQSGMFSSFVISQIDELVGIDIGTTSIKVCSLANTKGVLSIRNIVRKTYEQELISDGHIVDVDFLARELEDIFRENGIKSKNVACAVSSYSVISKKITMPQTEEDALENMISVEVENAIPFPMKDIYYTHAVIGPDEEKPSMMNVKIVAVKREIVDAYIAAFNMAGLNLQILDVDMFGISNVVELVYAPRGYSVLVVDIGASVTNIAILNGENIEFTREILMGGKYLTSQIQKSIKVGYSDAEEKKITADAEVTYLFEDFIFNISSEINKTVRFYLATKPKENIGKIFVTGGSSLLPGIKEKIVDETGIPVEVIDPFLMIQNGSSRLYEEFKEVMVVPMYLSSRVLDL